MNDPTLDRIEREDFGLGLTPERHAELVAHARHQITNPTPDLPPLDNEPSEPEQLAAFEPEF